MGDKINDILIEKIKELENAEPYQCWYITKQDLNVPTICYKVKYLLEYIKRSTKSTNIQCEKYVENCITELNNKLELKFSTETRSFHDAEYLGLIFYKNKYVEAEVTPTFEEITKLCKGHYELTETYESVIQRQIEKIFLSSIIDGKKDNVRKSFRLYPVMLLYKVLLELGRARNEYFVYLNEYKYFIATTKKNSDSLKTMELIDILRNEEKESCDQVKSKLNEIKSNKTDSRFIELLKQLKTLSINNDKIELKKDKIDEVNRILYEFEKNIDEIQKLNENEYLNFLGSTCSIAETSHLNELSYREKNRIKGGENIIYYGVPGSGKSYFIDHEKKFLKAKKERIVFHPDYTYSDFIGEILPVIKKDKNGNDNVSYKFTPGPFTRILKEALENPKKEFALIIEEINRGNGPAIFGDVFQLLDRITFDKDFPIGTSEYGINNSDIARYVFGNKAYEIRIPSNLYIIATMNTSDQNVFTLDTAFQRRWKMRLIKNEFDKKSKYSEKLANTMILDTTVSWRKFCVSINNIILEKDNELSSTEDVRLGVYFINIDDLQVNQDNSPFAEKVIKYLWDDAFKFNRDEIFDISNYNSLEKVIDGFTNTKNNDRFNIFVEDVRNRLTNTNSN